MGWRAMAAHGGSITDVRGRRWQARAATTLLGATLLATTSAAAQTDMYAAALVASSPSALSGPPVALDLYLDVFINGVATGLMAHVRQTPAGALLMEREPLRNIGLLAAPHSLRDDGWVDLSRLPGVQTRYGEATQTLHVQAQDAAMLVRVFDARGGQDSTGERQTPYSFGAFINHTLYASSGGQHAGARWAGLRRYQYASGLFEGNVYGRFGVLTSTQLLNLNRRISTGSASSQRRWRSIRLDTLWSWFDEDHLTTLAAGDFVGRSLSWSRSLRLGGLQWRRNFAIRPDLITMPLLSDFSGSAALPSTVELYVNNARRFAQDVVPGPFAVINLPLITGAGTARLVVRDALGRETVTETPFYASSQLLAPGLADFALEAGVARRNYGAVSNDYDKRLLASASARYGVTNAVTLEGMAQGGGRLVLAGAGGVGKLGTLGVAGLAGAVSRYGVRDGSKTGVETGSQLAANVELGLFGLRLTARHQRTQGDFNDLASVTLTRDATGMTPALLRQRRANARAPARMSQVSLALPYWSGPSVSLSYTTLTQHTMRVDASHDRSRTRLASINLGQRLPGNGWLSVSAYRDLARKQSSTVFASLSWFLGRRISASTSRTWRDGKTSTTTADLSRSEHSEYGSVGWRLRTSHGHGQLSSRTQAASASYRSRIGRIEAGVEHMETGKTVNGRLQLEGAVVLAGGGVFLSNRVNDAFGVVNVGAPGVTVKYENTPIGVTDARGQLLLPGLRAYERNQISIDPMTLPVDAHIPLLRQTVRPRFKSGVTVDFDVALQTRTALLTVRDDAGELLPLGATVQRDDGSATVVGYDGQIWLDTVADSNRLIVKQAEKPECMVNFTAPANMTERLQIPDAVCRRE